MPVPLNRSLSIPLSADRRPPGSPATWGQSLQSFTKAGWRWVAGDRKTQILEYNGTTMRLIDAQCSPSPDAFYGWYYEPGWAYDNPWSGWRYTESGEFTVPVSNQCYEKFKEVALGANASWGATIAEGREAFGLVAQRVGTLTSAYRALRKGDFRRFTKILKVKPKRKHSRWAARKVPKSIVRKVSRQSSALWLEYWFGWAPLAGEIYSSTVALTAEKTEGKHWAASGSVLPLRVYSYAWGATMDSQKRYSEAGSYFVKMGAVVRYDNPNHQLVQQLGLANPLAIAWELVPFSFVVDWFTNVGDVIGSITDMYGVSLTDSYTSTILRTTVTQETRVYGKTSDLLRYRYRLYHQTRRKGLTAPIPVVPVLANFGQSKTRAATAVSLLIQLFVGK